MRITKYPLILETQNASLGSLSPPAAVVLECIVGVVFLGLFSGLEIGTVKHLSNVPERQRVKKETEVIQVNVWSHGS